MKFILILMLVINSFAMDKKDDIKQIEQRTNKNLKSKESFKKTRKALDKLDESFKPVKKVEPEIGPKPKPRKQKLVYKKVPQNFIIYNFERLDETNNIQNDEIRYIDEGVISLEKQTEQMLIVLHSLQNQSEILSEEQTKKNIRYDHFFMRWDSLKNSVSSLWKVGGGALLTAFFTGIFWYLRRKKKKQNGGSNV